MIAKCVFCGREQEDYKGLYLIKNDGTMTYYCSSKCRKNNLKLGRDKKKIKWTSAYREARRIAEQKHAAAEAKLAEEHKLAESEKKHVKAKK